MFTSKDALRLADLSRLEFSKKDLERMRAELESAIDRAKKVFENEGSRPEVDRITVTKLREDNVKALEDTKPLTQNWQIKNNLFISIRVV